MKRKLSHPGFELGLPIPFLTMLTVSVNPLSIIMFFYGMVKLYFLIISHDFLNGKN